MFLQINEVMSTVYSVFCAVGAKKQEVSLSWGHASYSVGYINKGTVNIIQDEWLAVLV